MNYIIAGSAAICCALVFLYAFSFKKLDTLQKYLRISSYISCLVLLLIGIFDLLKIIKGANFTGIYISLFTVFGILLAIREFSSIQKEKQKFFYFCKITVLVTGILEIFLFNCNAFHTLGTGYPQVMADMSKASYSGCRYDAELNAFVNTQKNVKIEFQNVDIPIGTIFIDADFSGEGFHKQEIKVDFADETYRGLREDKASFDIIKNHPECNTGIFNFSGKVSKIAFRTTLNDGDSLMIRSIVLNKPVTFRFHYTRFFILITAAVFIWLLLNSGAFRRKYSPENTFQRGVIIAITAVLFLFGFTLTWLYADKEGSNLFMQFKQTSGDQLTQKLVDAFENGQVSLLEEPSQELLELENPYDPAQRSDADVSFLWDHVLYEGKYYSYYGIAPVILLFLPYHLITGLYFSSIWACLLFGLLGIFFLVKLYLAIMRRWFKDISFSLVTSGLIILLISSGVWFCFCSPLFYEIAQSCAFFFTVAGFYFLVTSNVISEGKISLLRISIATSMFALAVMSRPTEAIYALISLPFLWIGFNKVKKSGKKEGIKFWACALLPYVLAGSVQMAYNAARFGNPFDFGIQYSLTISDFTSTQFHVRLSLIGIYNYLFAVPSFKPEFPFFFSQFDDLGTNGFYFIAYLSSIGLFFRAIPAFGLFFAPRAYKRLPVEKPKRTIALLWILVCVVAPLIIMLSIWESGYSVRYSLDFAWQMILGAFMVLFYLFAGSNQYKNLFEKIFIICMVASVLVNLAQISFYIYPLCISTDLRADFWAFTRNFTFWL